MQLAEQKQEHVWGYWGQRRFPHTWVCIVVIVGVSCEEQGVKAPGLSNK